MSFVSPNKHSRNTALVAGIVALLFVACAVSIGAFMFIKSRSNVAAANTSSNTDYMANMDHMNHNMATGDDFAKNTKKSDEKVTASSVPLLSSEEADKVISHITQTTEHRSDGMQIIKTPKDTALVCIHNMIDMGKTHMFAVERPNINSQWEISARVSLDVPEFRGASWQFEPQDADNDGYEDVVFTAANADKTARRVLIYVPRTRQNYWVLTANDTSGKVTNKTFSPNAQTTTGAPFRSALEQTVQAR
jgi:hypothetical protein